MGGCIDGYRSIDRGIDSWIWYCDEYKHLLGNGSLARVSAATNINKDIPVTTGEWQLTVRGGGRYSALPKL
jgi:hypothetical protein